MKTQFAWVLIFLLLGAYLFTGGCHTESTPAFPPIVPTSTPTSTSSPTMTPVEPNVNCTSTSTPALIADFEPGNTGVLPDQCRTGFFYIFGPTAPPALSSVIASPGTGFGCASGSSSNAMHITSGPVTGYGAVFAFAPMTGAGPYDITGFTGIQFCGLLGSTAQAVGPNSFQVDDSGSGVLTGTFSAFTTSWQSFTLPFASMAGSENERQTVRFLWITGTTVSPADYWLDNISFY